MSIPPSSTPGQTGEEDGTTFVTQTSIITTTPAPVTQPITITTTAIRTRTSTKPEPIATTSSPSEISVPFTTSTSYFTQWPGLSLPTNLPDIISSLTAQRSKTISTAVINSGSLSGILSGASSTSTQETTITGLVDTSSSNSGRNRSIYIGIGVALPVGVALVVAGYFIYRGRRKKGKKIVNKQDTRPAQSQTAEVHQIMENILQGGQRYSDLSRARSPQILIPRKTPKVSPRSPTADLVSNWLIGFPSPLLKSEAVRTYMNESYQTQTSPSGSYLGDGMLQYESTIGQRNTDSQTAMPISYTLPQHMSFNQTVREQYPGIYPQRESRQDAYPPESAGERTVVEKSETSPSEYGQFHQMPGAEMDRGLSPAPLRINKIKRSVTNSQNGSSQMESTPPQSPWSDQVTSCGYMARGVELNERSFTELAEGEPISNMPSYHTQSNGIDSLMTDDMVRESQFPLINDERELRILNTYRQLQGLSNIVEDTPRSDWRTSNTVSSGQRSRPRPTSSIYSRDISGISNIMEGITEDNGSEGLDWSCLQGDMR
ncbi:hypothetical protein B0O99DRAFT_670126 [Bisporella sp. PMI_857]|nr:hypothetical protein B0O99DRAFT_670126 [Bisporella sp. PMI_857]